MYITQINYTKEALKLKPQLFFTWEFITTAELGGGCIP